MTFGKSVKGALLLTSLLVLPVVAFGQIGDDYVTGAPTTGVGVLNLIKTVANWFAAVLFVVAVIFIILAAFGYLTAGGEDEKIKSAKQKLVYAIVAVVVAALAFFIPTIIFNILGLGGIEGVPTTGTGG